MIRQFRTPVLLLALFTVIGRGDLLGQCGVERWSVKTGTDTDAGAVNLSSPFPTTVGDLIGLNKPTQLPPTSRIQPTETTLWTINATLVTFKSEGDSDYHLVISDDTGKTMIAEIPDPACVGSASPFATGIATARNQFNARFTPSGSFQDVDVPVQVTGVAMFDFLHGQRGVAPNGIEIHPVLAINFGGASPDFSLSASPGSVSLGSGSSTVVNISTNALGGFSSSLSFSAAAAPPGISASFNPTSTAAGGSTSLTIAADSSTAPGNYTLTIGAAGGGATHATSLNVTVTSVTVGDFSVSASFGMASGGSESATVSTSTAGGFSSDVSLSAPVLPSGISVTFNPPTIPAPGGGTSVMTIASDPTTLPGSYTLSILATSGAVTNTTTLGLSVASPSGAPVTGLVPAGGSLIKSRAFLAATRTLTSATPSTLRDDDDRQIEIVSSEDAIGRAHRHGGGPICSPQQHSIFLGKDWAEPSVHSREARLSDLVTLPGRGLCSASRVAATPISQEEPAELPKSSSLCDLNIQSRLDAILRGHHMKGPGDNTIYVVYLPPGIESRIGDTSQRNYVAYYNHFHSDEGEVRYVVVPFADEMRVEVFAAARALAQAAIYPEGNPM